MKPFLYALTLIGALAFSSHAFAAHDRADRGAPQIADVYDTFADALKTKDIHPLMRVCSKELANFSPGFSCGSLLNEAWFSGRTYTKVGERTNPAFPNKAVIDLTTTGEDKIPHPLFFLLEKTEKNLWVLKNISANKAWSDSYLAK